MSKKTLCLLFLLFCLLVMVPAITFAHGNGHKETNHSVSQLKDSDTLDDTIYAINDGDETKLPFLNEDPLSSPLANTDILSSGDPLIDGIGVGEPMVRFEQTMGSKPEHSQHEKNKTHIKESKHELVSTNAKGYRVAIGITVIFGLAFAGLSFFRIGEGSNTKKLS